MRKILFICLSLILSLSFPILSQGQNVSITGQIDRSEIQVGEQAAINMKVRSRNVSETHIIIPPDSLRQNYQVVSYRPVDTTDLGDGNYEISAQLVITAWDSCLLTIPQIYASLGNEKASIGPFTLKVTEPKVDISKPDSINEIKEPWAIKLTFKDILSIIFESPITYIILVILLALAAYYFYRRYKQRQPQKEEPAMPVHIDTPYEKACKELDLLRLKIGQNIDHKIFYSELIDILRRYLVRMTDIEAMEMVSSELSLAMKKNFPQLGDEVRLFDEVQRDADMAKYAKGEFHENNKREAIRMEAKLLESIEDILRKKEAEAATEKEEPEERKEEQL